MVLSIALAILSLTLAVLAVLLYRPALAALKSRSLPEPMPWSLESTLAQWFCTYPAANGGDARIAVTSENANGLRVSAPRLASLIAATCLISTIAASSLLRSRHEAALRGAVELASTATSELVKLSKPLLKLSTTIADASEHPNLSKSGHGNSTKTEPSTRTSRSSRKNPLIGAISKVNGQRELSEFAEPEEEEPTR